MPRTPRSRPDAFAAAPAMAIGLIFAAVVATLLAIVVLRPVLDSSPSNDLDSAVANPPGLIAAANVSPLEPAPSTATVAEVHLDVPSRDQSTAPVVATSRPRLAPGSGAIRTADASSARPADATAVATERPTPRPTRTPEPAATRTPPPRPTEPPPPTPTREPAGIAYYLAESAPDFGSWSGSSWRTNGSILASDGSAVVAQPWITGPVSPPATGGYAIEAEIRIDGLASGHCKQSIGLVAPVPGGAFIGGGWIYECDGSGDITGTRARLTDVSDYTNGYFQDPEFAERSLDLGTGWHTLRLEVDGGRVRLLIDDDLVLTATTGTVSPRNPASALGLWSEGVEVSVRRIAVVTVETN